MRLPAAVLVACLVAVSFGAGTLPATAEVTGPWPAWDAEPSGQFRSWVVEDGEFVWTNGVFQARGANTDGLHHEDYWGTVSTDAVLPNLPQDDLERHLTWGAFGADRWATDGDQELPLDDATWPAFTGEVAEFRVAADDDEVFLRWLFTSMPAPDAQIATVAFAGPGGGTSGEWPHGGGVTSAWDTAVTAWGTGGSLTTAGGTPVDVGDVGGEVRTGDHTVEVRLPRALFPAGPWTVTGGAGLTDPADRSTYWAVPAGAATPTAPGSGSSLSAGSPVWSLLFADDDPWVFTARSEGDLLVDGEAAPFTLDPALLAPGVDDAPAPRTGRLARQYVSAFDFGDGIVKGDPPQNLGPLVLPPEVPADDAARSFEYTGRLQPYGMLVDDAYLTRTEPWPLVVYLHGLNNFYYEPFGTLPNLELVGERGYLFAGLLGRGDLSYRGRGELDVMEVIADISRNYDVDPSRIHVMGHSMGSIGSHNVATRNPDLFASGAPAEITAANALVGNLRHVPWIMVGGQQDPLDLGSNTEVETYGLMSDLGYDVTFYDYLMKTHESSSIYDTLPSMLDLFDRTRRPADPAEVTYKRLPDDDHPELGLVHDRAYQVSDLVFADPSAEQSIDLESYAIPHLQWDPSSASRRQDRIDVEGPSGRGLAFKNTTEPGYAPAVEVRNAGRVTLANVASVTLAADRLAWTFAPGWVLDVSSDVPVALTLSGVGAYAGQGLLLGGAAATSSVAGPGALVVTVPAGDHQLTIGAGGVVAEPAPTIPAPLPATGGGLTLAALTALSAARVAHVRRRTHPLD